MKSGIISALGIDTGGFIYFMLAVFGISRILLNYPAAFMIIKYLGALYLFYIGITMIRYARKHQGNGQETITLPKTKHIYFQGIITCLLNPKVGVFFIAFLPQFIPANTTDYTSAVFTLGLVFAIMGTTWDISIAVLSGVLSKPFQKIKKAQKYLHYISGSILITLSLVSALVSLLGVNIV
jgi:threonine/homoserine/homoserine lactone efflux protein